MNFPIPSWCVNCHQFIPATNRTQSRFLCQTCFSKLPFTESGVCLKCGKNHDSEICKIEWAKYIKNYWSLFYYQEPVKQWISGLKYSRNLVVGRLFKQFVQNWLDDNASSLSHLDLVVPVPIHQSRLRERGFNQASYILGKQKILPSDEKLIRKVKKTTQQTGKTKNERVKTLKGAFKLTKEIRGKSILIFDDVCTTGYTLFEISKELHKRGAEQIDALTVCRTLSDV